MQCFTGGAFVIKGLPEGGNLSFMNFLFSATLHKENQNTILLRFSILELCVLLKYYLPLLNTNQTTVILPEEGAFAHLFMPYN